MLITYDVAIVKIPCHSRVMTFYNKQVAKINKLIDKQLSFHWQLHRDSVNTILIKSYTMF